VEHSASSPLDATQLLAALARHAVDFVLIGRPEPKRQQDLDDIAVLERLRAQRHRQGAPHRAQTGPAQPSRRPKPETSAERPARVKARRPSRDRDIGR
jgi:hypothetical protein